MIKLQFTKTKKGTPLCTIIQDNKEVTLNYNEANKVLNSFDSFVFNKPKFKGEHLWESLPEMTIEEAHDLVFDIPYNDGTVFSRTMAKIISNNIETKEFITFADILTYMKTIMKNREIQEIIYARRRTI